MPRTRRSKVPKLGCDHGSTVEVIAIGVTDDIYTVDLKSGTVELDNDMSDDATRLRVKCADCGESWEQDDDERADTNAPAWATRPLAAFREERGF